MGSTLHSLDHEIKTKKTKSGRMSNNLFGNPVTDATVQQVQIGVTPPITARHRAEVALLFQNADSKADDARTFVNRLKRDYGTGTSTLCAIYNATGNNLTFVRSNTWEGTVWSSSYPAIIQNGQWAAFLHVRGRLLGPSKEAIVYRGQNLAGNTREWVLAWNTSRMNYQNRVYTEVRTSSSSINWNTVNANMDRQLLNHSVTTLGCFSSVSVGAGSSPHFTGIMTLEGVNRDAMALATDISATFPSLDSEYIDDEGVDEEETPAAAAAAPPPAHAPVD